MNDYQKMFGGDMSDLHDAEVWNTYLGTRDGSREAKIGAVSEMENRLGIAGDWRGPVVPVFGFFAFGLPMESYEKRALLRELDRQSFENPFFSKETRERLERACK